MNVILVQSSLPKQASRRLRGWLGIAAIGLLIATLLPDVARADRHASNAENVVLRRVEAQWFESHHIRFSTRWQIGNVLISTVDRSWAADAVLVGAQSGAAAQIRSVVMHRNRGEWAVYEVATAEQGDCGVPPAVSSDLGLGRCAAYWYATTGTMEQDLEQTGLNVRGKRHDVLWVGCTGQGVPGAKRIDPKLGIKEPSYKQFLCLIRLAGSDISEIHIKTGQGTSYTWVAIA